MTILSQLEKKKKGQPQNGAPWPCLQPATGEPLLSSVSVGTPKCSVRVCTWPEPQASNSFRAARWGLGSGEIGAMYLCGPSVLACWAGKAVLILILHPLYFWGRRECPHTLLHYAQVVCRGNGLVAENGNRSYSCAVRFPGAPWGPGATPFFIRSIRIRVVVITSFPISIISSSPSANPAVSVTAFGGHC